MKDKILFFLALFVSKSYLNVLKILKKEQDDKPGLLACKIYNNFLEKVDKPRITIAVTGTNGKTTVTNLIGEMLIKLGNNVSFNTWGANTKAGTVRCFLEQTTIFNKNKADIVLLENDEITVNEIFPYVKPDYLVVTNLYRDSMHRNAHPLYVLNKINDYIPDNTILILNSDDPISSSLKETNRCVYYGIDKLNTDKECNNNIINDFVLCPKCNNEIKYIYNRFHQIGKFVCPNCGYKSKESDYLVTNIDLNHMKMKVKHNDKEVFYPIINDSIFNIYNVLSVITLLQEMGYPSGKIIECLGTENIVASRYTSTVIDNVEVCTMVAKGLNAVAVSRVCDYIKDLKGNIEIIMVLDDTFDNKNGSEAIAWIYDTDFELLNKENIKKIIIGGVRNKDYLLRLELAGIAKEKLVGVDDEQETYKYLDYKNINKIIVLHEVYYVTGARKIKENIIKELEKGEENEN